jgi:hypothetical protein
VIRELLGFRLVEYVLPGDWFACKTPTGRMGLIGKYPWFNTIFVSN